MIPEKDSYEICTYLDKCLEKIDAELASEKPNFKSVQSNLEIIREKLKAISEEAANLNANKKDSRNLFGRSKRVMENLQEIEALAKLLINSSQTNQKQPPIIQSSQNISPKNSKKLLSKNELLSILKPGKEIRKIELFPHWLDKEYSNKQTSTYMAYQSLNQSIGLNNSHFIGIRGDGDCGYRAMIASLFLQLAADPNCQSKFKILIENLDQTIYENQKAIPGYEKINQKCLQDLKNCNGDPDNLVKLLNQDDFMNQLTKIFRFLSNACCMNQLDKLPEEIQIQLQFGDGALQLGGLDAFLERNATVDVESATNLPGYLFAGIAQIFSSLKSAWDRFTQSTKSMRESQNPEVPNESLIQNPLVVMNLLCRDTRHFDVIF